MSGWETDFNIESTKYLSKNMWKIIDVETHFESMLGPWAHLEPPWHLKGQGGHSKLPLLRILSQNGTPLGPIKSHWGLPGGHPASR